MPRSPRGDDGRRRQTNPHKMIITLPLVGLSDAKIRDLANKIITEMVKRKMNVAGIDN